MTYCPKLCISVWHIITQLGDIMKPKDILTKELLEEEFVKNKLSVRAIAEKYGIKSTNSVNQAIERFGLTRESLRGRLKNITREWLVQKYIDEDLSAKDIAALFGMKRKAGILELLHKYDIPIRKTTSTKKFKECSVKRRRYGEMTSNYFSSLEYGARSRGLEWSITGEYAWELFIKQDRKCALTGVDLIFSVNRTEQKSSQTASLDRINSKLGYTENNIQWIHKDVNRMKWDLDEDIFINWCELIIAKRNRDNK